eukprot:4825926-Prorocentrum_lima.AAC.1
MLEEASKAVKQETDKALLKNGPWVLCSDGATIDNMGFVNCVAQNIQGEVMHVAHYSTVNTSSSSS